MRKLILVFFFFVYALNAQQKKVYSYYMELGSVDNADEFININNKLYYVGKDLKKKDLFSKYEVLQYNQAFPDALDQKLLKIYVLKTTSSLLASDLIKKCKETYKSSDEINIIGFLEETNYYNSKYNYEKSVNTLSNNSSGYTDNITKTYYPNDYGITSPITNLGENITRKDLDYLNAPKAWYITRGNPNIKIGIPDLQIGYNLPDLSNKVNFITPTPPYASPLGYSHGTSVAAMAAGRGDNASGSVGVCMECSIVGSDNLTIASTSDIAYSNLYKMAKAGAKVINMSWYSIYYTNSPTGNAIEQSVINDLVNNYRVTLVAAAGNLPSFSTPQSYISNEGSTTNVTPYGILYIYPASYDNVISVSSINHLNPYTLPLNNNQPSYCCTSDFFPIHLNLENSITTSVSALDPFNPVGVLRNGYSLSSTNPDGLQNNHTLNEKVDILANGYLIYYNNNPNNYGVGTSFAAP